MSNVKHPLTEKNKADILRMYDAGKKYGEISQKLKLNRGAVTRYCKKISRELPVEVDKVTPKWYPEFAQEWEKIQQAARKMKGLE